MDPIPDVLPSHSSNLASRFLSLALPPVCPLPDSLWNLPTLLVNNSACLNGTISRFLGFGVIFGAGLIKLPQIAAILSAGTVQGLSLTTFLVETFGYTYNLAAHYRGNYPISTYGDFFLLIIQNLVILLLFLLSSNQSKSSSGRTPQNKISAPFLFLRISSYFILYISLLLLLCSSLFPQNVLSALVSCNILMVVLARVPQIRANYINASTGALSLISSAGIWLGATARVFTTLQDVDSRTILYGYLTSSMLNGIVTAQVVFYRFIRPKLIRRAKIARDAKSGKSE